MKLTNTITATPKSWTKATNVGTGKMGDYLKVRVEGTNWRMDVLVKEENTVGNSVSDVKFFFTAEELADFVSQENRYSKGLPVTATQLWVNR